MKLRVAEAKRCYKQSEAPSMKSMCFGMLLRPPLLTLNVNRMADVSEAETIAMADCHSQ